MPVGVAPRAIDAIDATAPPHAIDATPARDAGLAAGRVELRDYFFSARRHGRGVDRRVLWRRSRLVKTRPRRQEERGRKLGHVLRLFPGRDGLLLGRAIIGIRGGRGRGDGDADGAVRTFTIG